MDYYERALFNHILPSQDPDNGTKTYFLSTEPGHFKTYCSKDESFWCCTGTGMENPARYSKNIYFLKENILYINQFISSQYDDTVIKIIQKTSLPSSKWAKFEIFNGQNLHKIRIRVPSWSKHVKIFLNSEEVNVQIKNGYADFENLLGIEDIIEVEFNLKIEIYKAKDNPNNISFIYGPVVLAGAMGKEGMPYSDNCISQMDYSDWEPMEIPPIICKEENLLNRIEKISDFPLIFKLNINEKEIKLVPFYDIAHERYTLYWERYDSEKEMKPRTKEKKDYRLMDKINLFEQQSEIDHMGMKNNSEGAYSSVHKRFYRYAKETGYFSYEIKVKKANQYFLEIEELIFDEESLDFIISIDETILFRASMRIEKDELIKKYKMELHPDWFFNKETVKITIKGNNSNETGKISSILINCL